MSTIIFAEIRENDNIVDKNTVIITMLFQRSVYKMLYVRRGVCITYKTDIGTFYSLLADKSKAVLIIGMYYKLEKEVRYVDDYEIFLFSNRIDNLLL